MSKVYQPHQKLFSKPYNDSSNNINQSVQDIIDLYSQNNPYLKNISNNRNNITIDYPKHYSPSYRSPVSLPSINSNFKKPNHSQVKKLNNSINEGNLFSSIGSNILKEKKPLKRDRTEIMLLNNNNNSNILPQINNITNINIHIYQNGNHNFPINNNGINTNRKKMKLRGNIKINNTFNKGGSSANTTLPISIPDDFNPIANNIPKGLINSNSNQNITGRKDNNNINNNNNNSLSSIDNSVNFLRDFSNEPNTFILFLKLIQSHMDIEIIIDKSFGGNRNNVFRRKTNIVITNETLFRLSKLINNYFNIISAIYSNNTSVVNDNFFLFQYMNNLFHKCIKVQMLIFSSLMVTLSQLGLYEISSMIKNHFHKIIKELTNPLLNIFELFIHEELNINYPDMIKTNLRPDFTDRFNKIYVESKLNKVYKNSELLSMINKNIDKCSNSLKYYSTLNLKYSLIKPYGDALNQLIISVERKTLTQFSNIILNTILFGELEVNRNKLLTRPVLINSINNIAPFLPPIEPKFKFTLVLDMDETLIHFFFTHINGMFFVRPYCLDFLNELNNLYEIITFTAGTKDYADNILNQLDINGDIIKYRLYRQHTSIIGCNVYKDLSKIGRDLNKTIIIDNLRENFKMQPNNGIFIKTWTSDVNDTQFRDLKRILKDIVELNVTDVKYIISRMNEDIRLSKNVINPYANIDISKYLK